MKTLVNTGVLAVLEHIANEIYYYKLYRDIAERNLLMTYKEIEKENRCEVAYLFLISKIRLYKEKLEKVTLFRKLNSYGRYVSNITCYISDTSNNIKTLFFRLYDAEYLWFMCAVQEDFPEVAFEDLTPEEYKIVKTGGVENDVQTSTET